MNLPTLKSFMGAPHVRDRDDGGPAPRDSLSKLRLAELVRVRASLPAGAPGTLLEIGGGNGFQSSWLRSWGYSVRAVDVEEGVWAERYAEVLIFDGTNLPFPHSAFDVVFSSNVLEHVPNQRALLVDSLRVLRPGGLAIHLVPTPCWRFWTSLAHYPWLFSLFFWRSRRHLGAPLPSASQVVRRRGILGTAWRVIFAAPHGKDQSSFVELFSFSRKRWLSTFSDCGFEAVTDYPSGLFYTGYGLVPSMSLEARRRLARWLGSACRVYVLRRPNG